MSQRTYQTRLNPTPEQAHFLHDMATMFSIIGRELYLDLRRGADINQLKRDYQLRHGINARQFNSIHANVKGLIKSRQTWHSKQIAELQEKMTQAEKTIARWDKRLQGGRGQKPLSPSERVRLKFKRHHKMRYIAQLQAQLDKLRASTPRLTFGGRKLFMAQYELEANGYESHDQWLTDWRAARHSEFLLVGSSDETHGNQCAQLHMGTLSLRVPPGLEGRYGNRFDLTRIEFAYGASQIDAAWEAGQSITYRFIRKAGAWYLHATVSVYTPEITTSRKNGALGIDLNPKVIGWSLCDPQGNLKRHGQIPLNMYNRTSEQVKASLGNAVKELIAIAGEAQVPIVVEKLNFSQKKAAMREQGPRYARMLSGFAYDQFKHLLSCRAEECGIYIWQVNPAYSSLIGLVKYMKMYGFSSDTAAAFVLARRAYRYSERMPVRNALASPVDGARHVWSSWRRLAAKVGRMKMRRHAWYSVGNTDSEVNPSSDAMLAELGGKVRTVSEPECDSQARMVGPTARPACLQLSFAFGEI